MNEPIVPFQPAAGFQNATAWYNLTAWAANVTRYAPSLEDLVWAGPRMFKRLGAYINVPDAANAGSDDGGFLRAEPSAFNFMDAISSVRGRSTPDVSTVVGSQSSRFSLEGARGLGSVFNYATSRWALSCIAMAIVLNRTHIFAATRRRLRLQWKLRFLLRFLPLVLLLLQARRLLQSMQCQTSADFSELRWGNSSKSSDLLFVFPSTTLNTITSTLLFGASDEQSCISVGMIPDLSAEEKSPLRGSLSALWPLFGTFCLSHFVETVSCAVQGRPLSVETGMTLFEQSLAFAEADATINNQLGQINFGVQSRPRGSDTSVILSSMSTTLSKASVLRRINTPPEVLLVAFLSTMTHITSHSLGLFDLQSKYRLVTTAFWGLCYMGSLVWSAFIFDLDDVATQSLLRFPTVCIIGFLPHILVLTGIVLCLFIYGLALFLSALSPPANQERASMSFRQRIMYAHENMQANVSLSAVRMTREMDFYTALLRAGFAAITMASEAVYLNEDGGVNLKRHTWLEEARFREAEEMQRQWIGTGSARRDQIGAIGLIPVKNEGVPVSNGYARERAAQKVAKGQRERAIRTSVGASERSSRWLLALDFFLGIARLMARVGALITLWMLKLVRIRTEPRWLRFLANHPKSGDDKALKQDELLERLRKERLSRDRTLPPLEGIDVAAEFQRLGYHEDEAQLQKELYDYFKEGGPWGSGDSSGDYLPPDGDDLWDTTSVMSMSTQHEETDNEEAGWESEASGQRTPTQRSPRMTRENTPVADSPMDTRALARLLQPGNMEEREEAATLAAHFQSDSIMTRANFRRLEQLRRTRVLTSPARKRRGNAGDNLGTPIRPIKWNPDEEEHMLEQLIFSRRQAASDAASNDGEGHTLGDDDDNSPQCVVCQTSPRTIIVWPCRCLSLCDDCRVSLAMNNFDKCVCCRRDVLSFSRIYVP